MVRSRLEEVDSEQYLLVFLAAVSAYMVLTSFEFGRTSAVFPQFTGGATLVCSLLLLFRDYLPEPLHTVVAGSTNIFQETEQQPDIEQDEDVEEPTEPAEELDRPLNPSLFTGILIAAYIGLSYLFSMFLMSPLFVIAYLVYFRQPWYIIVFLTALATLLAYAFTTVLIVPVDEGVFFDFALFVSSDAVGELSTLTLPGGFR